MSNFIRNYFLNSSNYQAEGTEVLFDSLTLKSQEKLLAKTVRFQGRDVSFRKVVNVCNRGSLNSIIDPETIATLSQNKLIKIGTTLPHLGDVGRYYIDRQIFQALKVQTKILWDERLFESNTLIAISNSCQEDISRLIPESIRMKKKILRTVRTLNCGPEDTDRILIMSKNNEERDFERFCREYPECNNIHWLQKTTDDFIWKKTHGKSLFLLREYLENCKYALEEAHSVENSSIKLVDFDDVNRFQEKIIIIAAEPGMGKTTAFTQLGMTWLTNNTKDSQWLVRINLIEHKMQLQKKKLTSVVELINFFFDRNVTQLTKKLMESRLVESGDIVFLLDGFDEIPPEGQKNTINIIKLLQGTKVERIFISTRLHLRSVLEDNFLTLAYTLKPFFRSDQNKFLQKFWREDFDSDRDEACIQNFINGLLDCISFSIRDKDTAFMGIPLQMRMIAEAFRDKVKNDTLDVDRVSERLNVFQLYNRFVDVKYREYFKKMGAEIFDINNIEEDLPTRALTKAHRAIAFKTLFPEAATDFNYEISLSEKDRLHINRIGIIQIINDEPVFIHRTFAEYYVASLLAHRLSKKKTNEKYKTTLDFLKKELLEASNFVIKIFLDYRLVTDDLFVALLEENTSEFQTIVSNDPQKIRLVDGLGRNYVHYIVQMDTTMMFRFCAIVKRKSLFNGMDFGKQDYLGITPYRYAMYSHPTAYNKSSHLRLISYFNDRD